MKHYLQTMVWAALNLIKTNSPSKAEGFKMIEMLPSTRVLVIRGVQASLLIVLPSEDSRCRVVRDSKLGLQ